MFADAAERKLHLERVQQTHRPTPRPPDEEVQSGQVTLTAGLRLNIALCDGGNCFYTVVVLIFI